MTKRQRKNIIKKAMERIATGRDVWSCLAIDNVEDKGRSIERQNYAEFYEKPSVGAWIDNDPNKVLKWLRFSQSDKNQRLIMLAFYMEVGIE